MQNYGCLHAHAHGAHPVAIRDAHGDDTATLAAVVNVDGDDGLACKMTFVQCGGDFIAVEPGSAKFFKRSFGAAADRDTSVLQDFNSGVENGTLGSAEIWRGRNPPGAGAFKEIIAMPVFHGDDMQVGANVVFGVEELGEFADG